jgi:hypothetical protein
MSTVLSLIYLGLLCSLISIPSSSAAKAKGNVGNKEKVSRKLVDPFISATENEKQSLDLDSTLTVPTKSAEQWIRDYRKFRRLIGFGLAQNGVDPEIC